MVNLAKKINSADYIYVTAYIRAKETKLLSRGRLEQLISAQSVRDAGRILEDCGYGEMSDLTPEKLTMRIGEKRAAVMADLASSAPDSGMLDIFRMRYDYHNGKTLVKAEALGIDGTDIMSSAGRFSPKELTAAFRRDDMGIYPDIFAAAVSQASETLSRTGDPQLSDIILDRAYAEEFISLAESIGSPFILGYAKLSIDATNLKTAVRAVKMGKNAEFMRKVLSPGGNVSPDDIISGKFSGRSFGDIFAGSPLKDAASAADGIGGGSVTAFESMCDGIVSAYLKQAGYVSYGPEVMIAYISDVEEELSNVRKIMTGKMSGLSQDRIRAALDPARTKGGALNV